LRLKYLQTALPKLQQDKEKNQKIEEDGFLGSESLWEKSVKPTLLVSKADTKDLLDTTALNSSGSKISSIQITGNASTKEGSIKKVEKIKNFFINGATLIQLNDLIRSYELKAIQIDSNLKKKIASAEVELEYSQKRIRNLNELKNQYPTNSSLSGQVVDAKDSGAKYLPVTTQIVAATTDVNNIKETLARYRDEESQSKIYQMFVDKAKPLLGANEDMVVLTNELLGICEKISTSLGSGAIQQLAVEDIKSSLTEIKTIQLYGLRQIGAVDVKNPPYLKYILGGLFGGLFLGMLFAIGVKLLKQMDFSNKPI
jgi:deoxycytidine triphosphate deaminase